MDAMKDHLHLWMITAIISLILGIVVVMLSTYGFAGIALLIIGAIA